MVNPALGGRGGERAVGGGGQGEEGERSEGGEGRGGAMVRAKGTK